MVVIEDAYVTAKYSKTNSWLLDTIGEDIDEEKKLDELIAETQQAKESTPKRNEPVEKKSDALPAKIPKRLTVVVEDDMSEAFEDDDLIRQDKTIIKTQLNKVSFTLLIFVRPNSLQG